MAQVTLIAAAVFAASAGILLGIFICLFAVKKAAREKVSLEHRIDELSGEIHKVHEEHARFEEAFRVFPGIVKRLSQRQRFDAVPFTAVRVFREYLAASRIVYLARGDEKEDFVVVEGVGCPPDWKGTFRVRADAGIVAAAVRDGAVVMRDDSGWRTGPPAPDASRFEEAMGPPDIAIPIAGIDRLFGVIVAAGVAVPLSGERPLVSMLADIVACAFQNALVREAIEGVESADPLTGLPDREAFVRRLEQEVRRARNYELPLSLVLLDVDNLRKVNESWGNAAGDTVMHRLAALIRATTRCTDVAARCGGKEFAILMMTSDKEAAFTNAERLREAIAVAEFVPDGVPEPLKVTISGGVATFPEDGRGADALIRAAGEALANAGQAGCNRVLRARRAG